MGWLVRVGIDMLFFITWTLPWQVLLFLFSPPPMVPLVLSVWIATAVGIYHYPSLLPKGFANERLGTRPLLSPFISPIAFVTLIWAFYAQCFDIPTTVSLFDRDDASQCALVKKSINSGMRLVTTVFELTIPQQHSMRTGVKKLVGSLETFEEDFWGFFTRDVAHPEGPMFGHNLAFIADIFIMLSYLTMLKLLLQVLALILAYVQVWFEMVEHWVTCLLILGYQKLSSSSSSSLGILCPPGFPSYLLASNIFTTISVSAELIGMAYIRFLEVWVLPFTEPFFSVLNSLLSLFSSSALLAHPMGYKLNADLGDVRLLSSATTRLGYLYLSTQSRMWRLLALVIALRLLYICWKGLFVLYLAVPILCLVLALFMFVPERLFECSCPDHASYRSVLRV
jgi:hypothetical protein